jgi:hypothetical protein
MPFLVLLAMLIASVAHAQDPLEPNFGDVLGDQLRELGTSVGDYARLAGARRGRILKAERDLKECVARSCTNRPALEKELAQARAVDATVRKIEGALLASMGLPGFADFGDFLRKTITAINEEEDRKQEAMEIASRVEGPVKNWCGAGFKAQEVVEVLSSRGPLYADCVWDILQGWATPMGMKVYTPDGRSTRDVRDLYYILSKRELMAQSLCEKQVAHERDKETSTKVLEKLETCAAQYSEVARLKQMFERRIATERAKKQQEAEAAIAATARRRQECQGRIPELQAQITATNRELTDANAQVLQAEREYSREIAKQRLLPREARARVAQKRSELRASFRIDALYDRQQELIRNLMEVQKACVAAR